MPVEVPNKHQDSEPPVPPKTRETYQWRDGKERKHRPMDYYLQDVLHRLETEQVVIVEAETGVGKTTRIPQAILDSDPTAKIIMTQTRRPAVSWNARSIAKEMAGLPIDADISDEELYALPDARKVGWKLRGEDPREFGETRATLVIDQTLTNRIIRERKLPEELLVMDENHRGKLPDGYLIIDEAHQRTIQIDILLALIKEYLPNSPKTKVVITSATIDTQKFKTFFETKEPMIAENEQLYDVEVYRSPSGELGFPRLKGEHHTEAAIRAVKEVILTPWSRNAFTIPANEPKRSSQNDQLNTPKPTTEVAPRQSVTTGSVLVLLPGKEDIRSAMDQVLREAERLGIAQSIECMQCHGEMSQAEQRIVGKKVRPGTLRFVFATEILRSSVTIPQIVAVVDSLEIKRYSVDANGVSHLGKNTISGAEADQGKGRLGREGSGLYIPTTWENEYARIINRNNPEYWPQPAIQRESLTSVVLQIAAVGLSIRTLDLLDRPNENKINTAIERLKKLGALDSDEQITEVGQNLLAFSLEPERAIVFMTAEKLKVLPEAVIAAAILENEGIQFAPRKGEKSVLVTPDMMRRLLSDPKLINRTNDSFRPFGVVAQPAPAEAPTDVLATLPPWVVRTETGNYQITLDEYNPQIIGGAKKVASLVWSEFSNESQSDFAASIHAYRSFKAEQRRLRTATPAQLGLHPGEGQNAVRRRIDKLEMEWCQTHFINAKKIQMVDRLIGELHEEINTTAMELGGSIHQPRPFDADNVTKALISGLIDNVAIFNDGNYTGPMASRIEVSISSNLKDRPSCILIGGVRKVDDVGKKNNTVYFADMAAEVKPHWFMEVMPQLCRSDIVEHTIAYDADSGQVMAQQDTSFNNVKIKKEQVPITSEKATQKLARALVEGKTNLPAEIENRKKIERVKELLKRDKQFVDIDTNLYTWYLSQIGTASSAIALQTLPITITNDTLTQLLGFEYETFETRVLLEKPDTITLNGQAYPFTYTNRGGFIAQLSLPIATIQHIQWNQVPPLDGFDVEITVADKGYEKLLFGGVKAKRSEADSLSNLVAAIETQRQALVWSEFETRASKNFTEPEPGVFHSYLHKLNYQQAFEPLPQPRVWDEVTQAMAYPAYEAAGILHQDGTTSWRIGWYPNEAAAEEARSKAELDRQNYNEREYEKRNFDSLVEQAQALYQLVSPRIGLLNFDDPELYGLTEEEAKTVHYSDSLRSQMLKAKTDAGLEMYQAHPMAAIRSLNALQQRLNEIDEYYKSEGQQILLQRQEKENMQAPEQPGGDFVLLVYRTPSGKLIASPTAGRTSKRQTEILGLSGTQVTELSFALSTELSQTIRLAEGNETRPSTHWYEIPESGAYRYIERTLNQDRIDNDISFTLTNIPQEPGLYSINSESRFSGPTPENPGTGKVYPASYDSNNNQPRIALSLYEITQYLLNQAKQTTAWRLRNTMTRELEKEIWFQAQDIYEQLKDRPQRWVTPEQINRGVQVSEPPISQATDPVEAALQMAKTTTLTQEMRQTMTGADDVLEATRITDLSLAKTVEELRNVGEGLKSQLGTTGYAALNRLKLSLIIDKLEKATDGTEPDARSRLDIEQELNTFAIVNNLRFGQNIRAEQTPIITKAPITRETAPIRLTADTLRTLLDTDIEALKHIITSEGKNKQTDRWKFAVAALSAKGFEGRYFLIQQPFSRATLDAINKALKKMSDELERFKNYASPEQLIEAQIERTRIDLEIMDLTRFALNHDAVTSMIGTSENQVGADGKTQTQLTPEQHSFCLHFDAAVCAEVVKWEVLPLRDTIEPLIWQALEAATAPIPAETEPIDDMTINAEFTEQTATDQTESDQS